MGFSSEIIGLIGAVQANPVLRERLTLFEKQLNDAVKRNMELEEELTQVKAENSQLKQQLAGRSGNSEFEEARAALFKRKTGGGYVKVVYCPECHSSTSSIDDCIPFICSRCHWKSPFKSGDLEEVMKELPE